MESEIRNLDWMGPRTKAKALEKLRGIVNKIGYPDRWRDYSGLEVRRDDLLGNVQRGDAFEAHRQLASCSLEIRLEHRKRPPTHPSPDSQHSAAWTASESV